MSTATPDRLLLSLSSNVSQAIGATIRDWSQRPAEAQSVAEVEDAIAECLDDSLMKRALRRARDEFLSGPVDELNALHDDVVRLFDSRQQTLREVHAWAARHEAAGVAIPRAAELDRALQKLEADRAGWLDHWHLFTKEDLELTNAEIERGECMDVKEAFEWIEEQRRKKS